MQLEPTIIPIQDWYMEHGHPHYVKYVEPNVKILQEKFAVVVTKVYQTASKSMSEIQDRLVKVTVDFLKQRCPPTLDPCLQASTMYHCVCCICFCQTPIRVFPTLISAWV